MKENIEQMWCGGCGGKDYLIFRDMKSGEIMTECKQCKSVTRITFTIATTLEWDTDDQEGAMTSDQFHN